MELLIALPLCSSAIDYHKTLISHAVWNLYQTLSVNLTGFSGVGLNDVKIFGLGSHNIILINSKTMICTIINHTSAETKRDSYESY